MKVLEEEELRCFQHVTLVYFSVSNILHIQLKNDIQCSRPQNLPPSPAGRKTNRAAAMWLVTFSDPVLTRQEGGEGGEGQLASRSLPRHERSTRRPETWWLHECLFIQASWNRGSHPARNPAMLPVTGAPQGRRRRVSTGRGGCARGEVLTWRQPRQPRQPRPSGGTLPGSTITGLL